MRHRISHGRTFSPPALPASPNADIKRRRFLLTLGASGAVAAATIPVAAAAQTVTAQPAAQDDGYRESVHVRDYYRTARL
jgi:hypothetical protein